MRRSLASIEVKQAEVLERAVRQYKARRYADALRELDDLEPPPELPSVTMLRGRALFSLGRFAEGLEQFNQVIDSDSLCVDAHLMKANCLKFLGKRALAIRSYMDAEALHPSVASALILHESAHACDWSAVRTWKEVVRTQIIDQRRPAPPFVLLAHYDDPALQLENARLWANSRFGSAKPLADANLPLSTLRRDIESRTGIINIGYFSADYHGHATTSLIAELIELHDRSRFRVYGFSYGPNINDTARQRIERAFDYFLDVNTMSDAEVINLCRKQNIHIAVDLKGFTTDHRISLFIQRLAPIQIAYLGFPGTTGAKNIDYLVTDNLVTPEGYDNYYSEKLIRLPLCYQVNDRRRLNFGAPMSREELGFGSDDVILASFNNPYKITEEIFECWLGILCEAPWAKLWILCDDELTKESLHARIRESGLREDRLVFAPRVPERDHLRRLKCADLFLDTYPCSAHTTASDAVLCGVPLVTLCGKTFASRVAASILESVEMGALATSSLAMYKQKILELANSREKLSEIKQALVANFNASSLYRPDIFVKQYENELVKICNVKTGSVSFVFDSHKALSETTEKDILDIGFRLYKSTRHYAALAVYRFGLDLYPKAEKILLNAGIICKELKRYEEAKYYYKEFIKVNTEDPTPYLYIANLLREAGDLDEALVYIKYFVSLSPQSPVGRTVEAAILYDRGRLQQAILSLKEALKISPKDTRVAATLLKCYFRTREYEKAKLFLLEDFQGERTGELQSALAEVFYNTAEYDRALSEFSNVTSEFARSAEHLILGCNISRKLGRDADALSLLELTKGRWSSGKPIDYFLGNTLFLRRKTGIWEGEDLILDKIKISVKAGAPVVAPFVAVTMFDDWEVQRSAARLYAKKLSAIPSVNKAKFLPRKVPDRIKVAYFSSDFYDHATSHLLAGLIRSHDRSAFTIIGCNLGIPKRDAKYSEIRGLFDFFYEFGDCDDEGVVGFCRDQGFDIAIDLKGYTFDSRARIFYERIARVQISYLGYPGTMGADFMDYIILDRYLVESHEHEYFDEKILYMPHCYQANDNQRTISKFVQDRQTLGLDNEKFVFASFNNIYKITGEVFDTWMKILGSVPNSCLWILCPSKEARNRYLQRAERSGIDPERIVFADPLPSADHWGRMSLADLMLDTFPCNGHTTTSDALWMGVPVLTCRGNTMVSRVASSLLSVAGLADLVTTNLIDYAERAILLGNAAKPEWEALRRRVGLARESPLYDRIKFARDFESLLKRTL